MQVGVQLSGTRPGLRVLVSQLDASPKATQTRAEVEQLGRAAVTAQFEGTPLFVLPASMMLLGGGGLALWAVRRR